MVATLGKFITLHHQFRDVSHSNLIDIKGIPSPSHPECSNIAVVRAISTKPSKSLIWISAKDQRNLTFFMNFLNL